MQVASATRRVQLAGIDLGAVGGEAPLPAEFRLFGAGLTETAKGPVLFDARAAASVREYADRWGVELCIDLEHRAVDSMAVATSDTATDAMGWFRVDVRDNGELWASDVSWTVEGERRLRAKLQRYVSPCIEQDLESGRVLSVINCALTSMPATFGAAPLMAASRNFNARERAAIYLARVKRVKHGS